MKPSFTSLILFFFSFFLSCETTETNPNNTGSNNGSNTGSSGNTGTNQNPGSNNQVKPVSAFKVDRHDCIWPCRIQFTNLSTNTSGYFFSWKFGEEGTGREESKALIRDQRFLKDPYFVYYGVGDVLPQLHITSQREGGGYTVTYSELSYRIRTLTPMGLSGDFYCQSNVKANIRINTKPNNENTWFDLQIISSDNSRIPSGLYKRGGPNDQILKSNEPMASYYLTTNKNKQILVRGGNYIGFLQYTNDFIWKDEISELAFRRK